jgi:hypothetical protein
MVKLLRKRERVRKSYMLTWVCDMNNWRLTIDPEKMEDVRQGIPITTQRRFPSYVIGQRLINRFDVYSDISKGEVGKG